MQARLQVNRFPRIFAVVLFALTAAMVLGGALGYTLRAAGAGSGPSQTVVQQDSRDGVNPNNNSGTHGDNYRPF